MIPAVIAVAIAVAVVPLAMAVVVATVTPPITTGKVDVAVDVAAAEGPRVIVPVPYVVPADVTPEVLVTFTPFASSRVTPSKKVAIDGAVPLKVTVKVLR